jgi:hypothetical protein
MDQFATFPMHGDKHNEGGARGGAVVGSRSVWRRVSVRRAQLERLVEAGG